MSVTGAGRSAHELAADYCRRHGIERIRLTPAFSPTTQQRTCTVTVLFSAAEGRPEYRASFSLEGEDARIGEFVSSVDASGEITLADLRDGRGSPSAVLAPFLRQIENRIAKIEQEQSIQRIRFLGNSFLLHGTTLFTVVSDEDGRLGIEIHKGSDRQSANLMAGNLLDGLYDGSIQRVPRGAG